MRRALFAVALALGWLVLGTWAADVDWRAPLSPATEQRLQGNRFRAVTGNAQARDSQLHVSAADEDFSAVQSIALAGVAAADIPVIRYRFENFPRTLELTLMFRTAEASDDVQTIALPWPGDGMSTFDLSAIEKWQGTITELGFYEFATGQLVPPERGFAPFELVDAELWSPSWRGRIAALATSWFGAWPWSQRSVHALGREGEAPRAHSFSLVAALAAAIAVGLAALILRLRGRALRNCAIGCVAVAWLALDLTWQAGLFQRLAATRVLYADHPWSERARIVGDSDILAAADTLKDMLQDEPAGRRVLLGATSDYEWMRLAWHLLPLNVGSLNLATPLSATWPEDSLVVFYDSDAWRSNAYMRRVLRASQRVTGAGSVHKSGFESSALVVFRYRRAR